MSESNDEKWGVLAQFDTTRELYHACEEVRDRGFKHWDAHTPFPVHGLDGAMGVKMTILPWIVLVVGLSGTCVGLLLQTWVHSVAYPLVISGKPFWAWPTYVPIMFELSVLFAAGTAVFGMFAMNGLPQWNHNLFNSEAFQRVTDDKFFISIERRDPKYAGERTLEFLEGLGASHVEFVD